MQVAEVDPFTIPPPQYSGPRETVITHQSQMAVHTVEVPAVQHAAPAVQYAAPAVQYAAPAVPAVQYAVPQFQVVHTAPQNLLTDLPGQVTCSNCHTHCITRTRYKTGTLTWIIVITLLLLCLWPFAFIPLCIDTFKDVEHSCSTCGTVLHVHKQI
nr:cell death-inducing p53-target protein 1 homolog [Nerophis lumbriciformis]